MAVNYDLDTDSEHTLKGCMINSATISSNVGEAIKVKLEGPYAQLVADTSLFTAVAPVEDPFTFAQASLEIPNGTTIADVQNFEITVNRNVEMVWGLGSRIAQKNVGKQREYKIKLTCTYENDTFLGNVWGAAAAINATVAEVATAELTISNGGATTAQRSYVFLFGNCLFEKVSVPTTVEDVTKLDITITARTLTSLIATNNIDTAL